MYPELQIARVEQATQAIPMEHWCGGARSGHCAHPHHQVVPFRCLPGEFVSEALLVPEGCRFLHQERMDECESSTRRHQEAQEVRTLAHPSPPPQNPGARAPNTLLHQNQGVWASSILFPLGSRNFIPPNPFLQNQESKLPASSTP
ncbi:Amyloid-like protein 1 [Plecturocebus cupreus]